MKGKFIVFYGTNCLGKTTQAKRLVNFIRGRGLESEYVKYPIYSIESGKIIDEVLRSGKKQDVSEFGLQMIYTYNRLDFQPVLKRKLNKGINIVSEDYRGTGLAWGKAKGLTKSEYTKLDRINSHLLPEDVAFLFDGEPFKGSKEKNHIHESDDKLMQRCRKTHLEVGKEKGWIKINANQSKDKVFDDILKILREKFGEKYL